MDGGRSDVAILNMAILDRFRRQPIGGHRRPPTWQAGWCVRRDWPDRGHEFFGFQGSPDGLARRIQRDQAYWRRGPIRPVEWSVVRISQHDFRLHSRHRLLCRAPDCPLAEAQPAPHPVRVH
jgi:hypothetical protein